MKEYLGILVLIQFLIIAFYWKCENCYTDFERRTYRVFFVMIVAIMLAIGNNELSVMNAIHSCFEAYILLWWYLSQSKAGLKTYIVIVTAMVAIWGINNHWCPLTQYQDDLDPYGQGHATDLMTKYGVSIGCIVLALIRLYRMN